MRAPSPFDLGNPSAYAAWRESKLAAAPTTLAQLLVEVRNPRALSDAERCAVLDRMRVANMAIYASKTGEQADTDIPRRLGEQIGLRSLDKHYLADDDGISALIVAADSSHAEFIPYTDRAIRWHTDGYYNPPERTVRSFLLHCVRPAASGGGNQLLDHEIAYILLRDSDPAFVHALSAPDVMTIPARNEADGTARPAQPGPVFAVDADGSLHMRYTARRISIEWKDDDATRTAVATLENILASRTDWTLQGRLEAGMGLICNNVLHNRTAFRNDDELQRLLFRARYYERVRTA